MALNFASVVPSLKLKLGTKAVLCAAVLIAANTAHLAWAR